MDDELVLRSLGEDLARDDPRLAALLSDQDAPPRHRGAWILLFVVLTPLVVTVGLLVPPTVAVGVAAMVLAVASPLAVCWLCAAAERTAPRLR
jgi:hypothetical protein